MYERKDNFFCVLCILTTATYNVKCDENINKTTLYPVNKSNKKYSEEIITITDETNTKDADVVKEISSESDKAKTIESYLNKTSEVNKGAIRTIKSETTTWKIDADFSQPNLSANGTQEKLHLDENKVDNSEIFKPSQQLGTFYDEDAFVIPTMRGIGSFTPIKTAGFISSPNDFFKLNYKKLKEYLDKPYKDLYKPIKPEYDSKPTVEAPVKVPAGSLYKHQGPFKEKPGSDGDNDDFALDFHSNNEKEVKKFKNPWSGLLNLITALVPVGIIVSALTPSLVTLHTTENLPYGNHFSRRSVGDNLPKISERCKRRLLCELHSERNYMRQASPRQKHCYKIPCDDPDAMNRVLSWLLAYHRSGGEGNSYT